MNYFFDVWYFCCDAIVKTFHKNDVEDLFKMFTTEVEGSAFVADIGGGTGNFAQRLLEKGHQVTIIDPSRGMTGLALKKDPRIMVMNTFAENTGCTAQSFDAVCLIDSMHHFRDIKSSIFEAVRILKPQGLIFIKEFNPLSLKTKFLWLFEVLCLEKGRFFKPEELLNLLDRSFEGEIQNISDFEYVYVGRLRDF